MAYFDVLETFDCFSPEFVMEVFKKGGVVDVFHTI